ncbi:DUF4214 domain-containing protein [Hominifimenecus sp. rT4P-3]|uniref:DUF4214 domain-containing protein n=1 Tax=Hominifimenecus sp. rT4P-3 TaxID=3242979 RepID=UPI003DA57775
MTNQEKRQKIADAVISREGKNKYTQTAKRDRVASGWSDCSSLTHWAHKTAIGVDIGDDTAAQIVSDNLTTVNVEIRDGVPDESALLVGDLLFFRGRSLSRKPYQYVGHVETYVGNGETSGHGSGVGPTRKNMADYCRERQASSSPVPAGNRGLICVRRAVPLSPEEEQGQKGDWDGVNTEQFVKDLYVELLGRYPDTGGLKDWVNRIAEGANFREVYEGIGNSEEGRKYFVRELYLHLLKREPDEDGLKNWTAALAGGASKSQVYQDFLNSEEYQKKNKKS